MYLDHNSAIAGILKTVDGLSSEGFESILLEQEGSGQSLAETAIDLELITKADLLFAVSRYLDWPYLDSVPTSVPDDLAALVDERLAHRYGVVPFQEKGYELKLLSMDPFNNSIVEDLSFALNRDITLVVADPDLIKGLIDAVYGKESLSVEDAMRWPSTLDRST